MHGVEKNFLLDPRLRPSDPVYNITRGASKITYQFYPSQNYSNSQLNFQVVPNSAMTYLDRKVLVSMSADFTLTAANPADVIFPSGDPESSGVIGLRYMPLNNIPSSFQVTINGTSMSYTSNEVFAPMAQYNTGEDLEKFAWGWSPACKEPAQEFSDDFGTPRSQFASRWQNTAQDSNAVTANMELISNVPGTAVVRMSWTEPLLYPPFISGLIEREALIGLNSALILNWTIGSLDRFIGYNNVDGVPLASISAAWNSPPVLRLIWMQSPASPMDSGLGMLYKYPYTNITQYLSPPVTVAPGASVSISSNNIQLSGVPHCVIICVREQLQNRTPFDSDSFARIDGLEILFDNTSGILAGATPQQLYSICVNNGLKTRYTDFIDGCGSVLKLCFDRDIPISNGLSVGVPGTFQYAAQIRATNINSQAINYQVVTIVCYEGILSIMDGSALTQINLVTPQDVIAGSSISEMSDHEIGEYGSSGMYNGGSIIDTASNFVRRGKKFYTSNKGTIDNILHVGKEVGLKAIQLLPALLGAGLSLQESQDALAGAGFSGGGLSGGRLITNDMDLMTGRAPATKPILKRRVY